MKKKSSLKLRKGVLISIPIALLLAVLVGVLIVNNRKANLKTAKKVEVKSEKFIDDSMNENNRRFNMQIITQEQMIYTEKNTFGKITKEVS